MTATTPSPTALLAPPADPWLADLTAEPGLGGGAARGAASTAGAQLWRLLLQVGSTAVLARLLTPEHFGLVGMVLALTALADQLKDLGLGSAVVHARSLDQARVSALFWLNALVGLLLTVVVAGAAPLVAAFYGSPELLGVTLALSASYLLGGLGVQHQALLLRRLRLPTLARRDALAQTLAVLVALGAAALGAGVWSLVALQLVAVAARTAGAWAACGWRPSRPQLRVPGLRPLLATGSHLSGFTVLNYLARNLDNVLVGKVVGPAALGLYGRAYALLLLPLQQVTQPVANAVVPVLSRLRDEPVRYRSTYLRALSVVALAALPAVAVMAVAADRLVLLLLGERWVEAGGLFRALAGAAAAQVVGATCGWLYVSAGSTRRMLLWAAGTRPLVALSFVAGLPWGAAGVAWSYSTVTVLLLVPGLSNAARGTAVGPFDWVTAVWRPALVAVAAAGGAGLLLPATTGQGAVLGALLPLLGGAVAAALVVACSPWCRCLLGGAALLLKGGARA